jgi:hypothetical protein
MVTLKKCYEVTMLQFAEWLSTTVDARGPQIEELWVTFLDVILKNE